MPNTYAKYRNPKTVSTFYGFKIGRIGKGRKVAYIQHIECVDGTVKHIPHFTAKIKKY